MPRLFSATLRDNLLMELSTDTTSNGEQLQAALHQAVIERDVPKLERGLETKVGPRGVRLSGGQLQRTAAARMFVREPELLVFDDLSSALDAELLDRYLEAIFTAPLEKELEFIEAIGKYKGDKPPVTILDPAADETATSGRSLASLVSDDLDLLSHFDSLNPALARRMFDIGIEIGAQVADQYRQYLGT